MDNVFTDETIKLLDEDLNPLFIHTRKGGGNTTLQYVEGHHAIDQANRIFGYGNWAFKPLSIEQVVILDPCTGEAAGVCYKAKVELTVRGCIAPIVEVGSQPVASWNVKDTVMASRKKGDTKEIEEWEVTTARRKIAEAHEQAEKSAVTDAMKRALRMFGNQFGNSLYGDGQVDLSVPDLDEIKKQWIITCRIKQDQVEARWTKFKAFIAGGPTEDQGLTVELKQKMWSYINSQRKAS